MVTVPQDAPAWARQLADDVNAELRVRARGFPVVLAPFSKTDLPDAARWRGAWIYVTDATGGAIPAYSNGSSWRTPANAVIS